MKKYRHWKLTSDGYGLTDEQISILDEIFDRSTFDLQFADRLERVFPTYHFQIGHIGASRKIVKWHPNFWSVFPTDDGKYCITRAGDTLQEAFDLVVNALPEMYSFAANPKYYFKVNYEIPKNLSF